MSEAPPSEFARVRRQKRILLAFVLVAQLLAYVVLAQARYLGQGLSVQYVRFTTVSDVFSLGTLLLIVILIVLALWRPERIGRGRTIALAAFSTVLLWLDFGVRRQPASEFPPEAAIALIVSMSMLLAVLLTHSRPQLTPAAKTIRIVRNGAIMLVAGILFAFAYAFVFPTYSGLQEITDFNADAGVVLGAAVWSGRGLGDRPSPALRERLDVGYELLERRAIPRLVLTGGSSTGELPEAEVARRDLVRRAVDPSQLVTETETHSTLEQVRYLAGNLRQKQNWSRFVLISDQYHLARVTEMCRFNDLTVIGTPSRIHQPFLDLLYYRLRESVALLEYWLLGR